MVGERKITSTRKRTPKTPPATIEAVKEQIGVQRKFNFRFRSPWDTFLDSNRTDYSYYDKLRRGRAKGLEISGLLIRPLTSKITAWVLGKSPLWQTENETVTTSINQWWQNQQSAFMRAYQESLDLGDCYVVFNGDSSVTVVPPNVVERILDPEDLQSVIGYRITTSYSEEEGFAAQTFIDEYYADKRIRTVKNFEGAPLKGYPREYKNPLRKIPVVHIANRFGVDELFGRSLAEPLVPLLIRYGDVLDAALKGNIRQGRPTPTINKMGTAAQMDDFWERFGTTEKVTMPDGSVEERTVIHFDPDMLLTLGGDAAFKYEAPGSFVVDTEKLLGLLFYITVQHSELPEAYWGNAISSSKASAEAQTEPYIRYIEKMRMLSSGWINPLIDLYITWLSVFDRTARNMEAIGIWKPTSASEARLVLDSIIWLYAKKMIDPTFATWLTPVNIADPEVIRRRAEEYWGDEYATDSNASTSVPASGGGDQEGQFNKQENPVSPTERMMTAIEHTNGYHPVEERIT